MKVTVEKEQHIIKLHGERQPIAAIARLVGLTRKTVYAVLSRQLNRLYDSSSGRQPQPNGGIS